MTYSTLTYEEWKKTLPEKTLIGTELVKLFLENFLGENESKEQKEKYCALIAFLKETLKEEDRIEEIYYIFYRPFSFMSDEILSKLKIKNLIANRVLNIISEKLVETAIADPTTVMTLMDEIHIFPHNDDRRKYWSLLETLFLISVERLLLAEPEPEKLVEVARILSNFNVFDTYQGLEKIAQKLVEFPSSHAIMHNFLYVYRNNKEELLSLLEDPDADPHTKTVRSETNNVLRTYIIKAFATLPAPNEKNAEEVEKWTQPIKEKHRDNYIKKEIELLKLFNNMLTRWQEESED